MRQKSLIATCCLAGFLIGCGESVEGPGEDDLARFLEMEMDQGISVDDIDIVAAQNVGDEIEPVYRTRANVDFIRDEDFGEQVGFVDGKSVVKITSRAGEEIPAVLFTRSVPIGEDWKVEMEKVDIASKRGVPLSSFEDYVLEGSAEEKAARVAEKKKMADAESKLKAEQEAAVAAYAGTWSSGKPVSRPGGAPWSNGNEPLAISLKLNAAKDNAGTGTMTLRSLSNASNSTTGQITYSVSLTDGRASIVVPQDIRVGNSWVTAGNVWYLYPNGVLELSQNTGWRTELNPPQ